MSDKTNHPPLPQAFADLGVRTSILRGLADAQFVTPSEIQALLIPRALTGVDILGQARTGTGKTAAFGIPILQKVERGLFAQALIMVPTRELAIQVETEIRRIGSHTPIRVTSVVGGQRIRAQVKHLDTDPEVIVGTPGRVIDLLDRRLLSLSNIRFIVLDEVDRMLDIGFRDDIRNILSRVGRTGGRQSVVGSRRSADDRHNSVQDGQIAEAGGEGNDDDPDGFTADRRPPIADQGHQTIFVSATISDEIDRLARKYMREPIEKLIAHGADEKPTVDKIEQGYFVVDVWDKFRLLKALLDREQPELVIVFCRTKHGADKVAHQLRADGIECREIHGDLRQSRRDKVMKSFRGGKFEVLVATDLASRGIDVAGISHIINYDIPEDPEVYVHRIGRTARMGAEGKAYTFVLRDQGDLLTKVENLINMMIPPLKLDGWEPRPPPRERAGVAGPGGPLPTTPKPTPLNLEVPATPIEPAAPARRLTLGSKIKRSRRR